MSAVFHTLFDVRRELAWVYGELKARRLDPKFAKPMIAALKELGELIEQERVERRMSVLDQKIAVLRQMLAGTQMEDLPEWARLPVIEHGAIVVREERDVLDE